MENSIEEQIISHYKNLIFGENKNAIIMENDKKNLKEIASYIKEIHAGGDITDYYSNYLVSIKELLGHSNINDYKEGNPEQLLADINTVKSEYEQKNTGIAYSNIDKLNYSNIEIKIENIKSIQAGSEFGKTQSNKKCQIC